MKTNDHLAQSIARVIDKVRTVRRSAGFQPAVSPISNRQNVALTLARGLSGHPQAGSPAIQQVGNLRYDFVHGPVPRRKTGLRIAVGLAALLFALPLISAEHGGGPRGAAPRPAMVDRSSHGTIRHVDTHVVERPVEVRHEPDHPVEVHREGTAHRDVLGHHDVDVDIHRRHFWNDFAFGRRLAALPFGCLTLQIGGLPYYYDDGIYYQPVEGGYQEVYPPVGAAVPQPPAGAIEIYAGGQTYYYAGGAFYVQQPDGTYAIAPTPIGVVVPELPPGAIQVSVKGTVAYQFNGVYYEPVFVNGVTQYETFMP